VIRHLGSVILDFIIFLKSDETTEIKTKSSQNANGWKIEELSLKKSLFGQTFLKFVVVVAM